jgi:type VI protein secretion system component VasF
MSHTRSPEELEQEVARQREQLADTVDALQAKLDVKAHAQHKAQQVRSDPMWIGGAVAVVVAVGAFVLWRRRR